MTDIPELLDPERRLALAYAPAAARPALAALWTLDEQLGRALAVTQEPMLAQIRLAWWRDALAALGGAPPPIDPLLRALEQLPFEPAMLARIAEGWMARCGEPDLEIHARERGAVLFRLSDTLLGGAGDAAERAGEGWALADAGASEAALERLAGRLRLPRPLAVLTAGALGRSRGEGPLRRMLRLLRAGIF